MMSSFASVLVAKANATPENVVPCRMSVRNAKPAVSELCATYKVDADDELCLASLAALDLCETPLSVCVRAGGGRCAVAVARRLLVLHGVAGRGGLLVELLLVLRGVLVAAAGVDGWGRHGRGGSALVRMRGA